MKFRTKRRLRMDVILFEPQSLIRRLTQIIEGCVTETHSCENESQHDKDRIMWMQIYCNNLLLQCNCHNYNLAKLEIYQDSAGRSLSTRATQLNCPQPPAGRSLSTRATSRPSINKSHQSRPQMFIPLVPQTSGNGRPSTRFLWMILFLQICNSTLSKAIWSSKRQIYAVQYRYLIRNCWNYLKFCRVIQL
jgi:hypothetical protein